MYKENKITLVTIVFRSSAAAFEEVPDSFASDIMAEAPTSHAVSQFADYI
jgi:hypothetical protein